MMKQLIFKSLIFVLLSISVLSFITDDYFRDLNVNSVSFDEFNELYLDSLDILIIGSSHAKNSYNPIIIDSVFKTRTYNLGSAGQNYLFTNLLLEDVLAKAKPKLVIVDIFPSVIRTPTAKESKANQLRVIDYTSFTKNEFNLINTVYSLKELPSVYSETIRNHDKWHDRNNQEFVVNNKKFLFRQGYFNSNKVLDQDLKERYSDFSKKHNNFLKVTPSKNAITEFNFIADHLKKTIQICEDNNVELLFVSSPYFDSFYKEKFNVNHVLLNEFFKQTSKVDFIDFGHSFNSLGLSLDDFWDKGHLNINGSRKLTFSLSEKLSHKKYFPVRDSSYLYSSLKKLKSKETSPYERNNSEIELNEKLKTLITKSSTYDISHSFGKTANINSVSFAIDKDKRYIILDSSIDQGILSNHYFLISKTVNESDFHKRPNWQLNTNKNQLHWEVFPKKIQSNDKSFILLEFEKKCDILKFDEVKLHLKKRSDKKSIGRTLILNNIKTKRVEN